MINSSVRFGGGYTTSIYHFTTSYTASDLHKPESWKAYNNLFGNITAEFDHDSKPALPSNNGKPLIRDYHAKIYVSSDGLMVTEVPCLCKNGGRGAYRFVTSLKFFSFCTKFWRISPSSFFAEKDIAHIAVENNQISQVSSGGDQYSETKLTRALHRYQPPLLMR